VTDALEYALAATPSVDVLIPGDALGIFAIADYLRAHSDVLTRAASSLSRVEVTSWRGTASAGFQAAIDVEPGRWTAASVAFTNAATAVESYAAELGPAREKAAQAQEMYVMAVALGAVPARIAPTDSYAVAPAVPGKVAIPPPVDALALDVRALETARHQAVALLAQARAAVAAAGDIAANTLRAAMAEAPGARRFFEATIRPAAVEEPAHMGLDVLGMFPAVGAVPDLMNAGWYSTEGRHLEAGLSLLSAVPGVGDAVGGAVIVAGVASKIAVRGLDRASLLTKAGNEVRLGRGALDAFGTPVGPGRLLGHVPYGFGSRQAFDTFSAQANKALADAGVTDGTVYLRGSSVTGYRYRTGESIATQGPGDLDLAVVSPALLEKARGAHIQLRGGGTRSMPLYRADLAEVGLGDLVAGLTKIASRKVTVMIYTSDIAILNRGDAILLP